MERERASPIEIPPIWYCIIVDYTPFTIVFKLVVVVVILIPPETEP
jgi:hypothetical protein